MKTLSTTSLATKLGIPREELFKILNDSKFIYRKDNKWHLTSKGNEVGGKIAYTEAKEEFIVWPDDFNPKNINIDLNTSFINATRIGEEYRVSNQRVNNILCELGWIDQAIKGWKITQLGKNAGGVQKEHQSGGTYVIWPESILKNKVFLKSINPTEYIEIDTTNKAISFNQKSDNKYPDTLLKTTDGHWVRSRAELIIDNLLYDYGLTHSYERELTVEDTVISDFYIPSRNGKENKGKAVYIEFWGIDDNQKYLERKKAKQEIYKKHNLNLIEIDNSHLDNLDSYLRKALLKFDINVE